MWRICGSACLAVAAARRCPEAQRCAQLSKQCEAFCKMFLRHCLGWRQQRQGFAAMLHNYFLMHWTVLEANGCVPASPCTYLLMRSASVVHGSVLAHCGEPGAGRQRDSRVFAGNNTC